jgi:hypothetical protein
LREFRCCDAAKYEMHSVFKDVLTFWQTRPKGREKSIDQYPEDGKTSQYHQIVVMPVNPLLADKWA